MALKEYPEEKAVIDGEKVRLELKSEQYDIIEGDIFELATVFPITDTDGKKNTVTFKSEGVLKEDGDKISLTYKEAVQTEMEGTETTLVFDRTNTNVVFVERRGSVSTAFYIEEGIRHISNYSTPFGDAEIATLATRVNLEMRGTLALARLDYIVELRGMTAQRTRMTIKIARNQQF